MNASPSELSLLRSRRFAPLFTVNLLGVFNDNLTKTALLVLGSYRLFNAAPDKAAELAMTAAIVFIAPFFLFSALAGQIADRFERVRLVRLVKTAEVAILAFGAFGFWFASVPMLLASVFLMGVHSAFFGPLKYALLPESLSGSELVTGTGLMEGGGFLAIIAGQLLAELIPADAVGLVTVTLAVVGLGASLAIPRPNAVQPQGRVDPNLIRSSLSVVTLAARNRTVLWCILAIAWFYAVGAVLLSQMIPLVESIFHAKPEVAALLLSLFSIGLAAGSILVGRCLGGTISPKLAAPSAVFIGLALLDLGHTVASTPFIHRNIGLAEFVSTAANWRIILDLTATAVAGGLFVIPLLALLQSASPDAERSRILAGNNILNALISAVALAFAGFLVRAGTPLSLMISILGLATVVLGVIAVVLVPSDLLKVCVKTLLRVLHRVEVSGLENLPPEGEGAVIVVNHLSYLDGLFLAAFLPGRPTFALHAQIAKTWWMKILSPLVETFPVDISSPMATKGMAKVVRDGRTLVIFPEGRITRTGALMKVFAGPALIADKAAAPVVAVFLDGLQFSPFSHMKGTLRQETFPKVRISVQPRQTLDLPDHLSPRQRRARATERLYEIMSNAAMRGSDRPLTLPAALLEARRRHGGAAKVLEDVKRQPLTYDRLILGSRILGSVLGRLLPAKEPVGILLPNINATVVTLFAVQAGGRPPALLNYTAGARSLIACCEAANLSTVVTARAFIEQAKLEPLVQALTLAGLRILWLEDISGSIGLARKLMYAARQRIFPNEALDHGNSEDPALILFTSGSEGAPKGVVLTHSNLLANCAQIAARIDFNPSDCVLNALPMFHSFGLTGGTLLALLNGVRTLLYPNPLHYSTVAALAYDASATILFGSDTFLAGYVRSAQPYDFYSLRYIFAGAEPVRPETRQAYFDKFGLRILEGYGATECAPVIALNTPMHFRAGSVGQPLPGLELRIDAVPGITTGGRLHLRGPNIMAGYLLTSAPGVLQPPADGWHDTGDIVEMDDDGYLFIRGRAKRFAKIGGEMVSLTAVERFASEIWPDAVHVAVARPHPLKGEEVLLLTTKKVATRKDFLLWAKKSGVSELWTPSAVEFLDEIPTLATGKVDYNSLADHMKDHGPSTIRTPHGVN